MTLLDKHLELRRQYVKEKDPAKKEAILKEVQELIASDPDAAAKAFVMGMADTLSKLEVLRIHEALDDILPFISQSYIAKTYFKRSRSWFSQRLNGSEVMGIVCSFDDKDISTLKSGLTDMRDRLDKAIEKLKDAKGFDKALTAVAHEDDKESAMAYIEKHL